MFWFFSLKSVPVFFAPLPGFFCHCQCCLWPSSVALLFEFFFLSLTPATYQHGTEAVNLWEHSSLLAQWVDHSLFSAIFNGPGNQRWLPHYRRRNFCQPLYSFIPKHLLNTPWAKFLTTSRKVEIGKLYHDQKAWSLERSYTYQDSTILR